MNIPIVVVTEGSAPAPLAWLKTQVDVREVPLNDPKLDESLASAQGLVIRTYTKVTEPFLDKCPQLRVIGRGGVGVENIDVKACRRRGIEVVFTPDANTLAVGDFVIGLMLQLLRPWCFFKEQVYPPAEFKAIRERMRGRQLNESTLGILGMGRVGRRMGHIAALGFGMRVIYNDLENVAALLDFPATSVDAPTLYRDSDVLSIHVDMRPGNEHLVGRDQIAQMRPTSILINTSRGEVLDPHALAAAIREKRLAGAALDVYSPEPPERGFPLLGFDNVLLSPHMAARTETALENMSWVVRDVVAVLVGQKPVYPVPTWR